MRSRIMRAVAYWMGFHYEIFVVEKDGDWFKLVGYSNDRLYAGFMVVGISKSGWFSPSGKPICGARRKIR